MTGMTPDFEGRKEVEINYCIFDRKTGEVLAIETRYVPSAMRGDAVPGPAPELLRSLAAERGAKETDIDVLEMKSLRVNDVLARVNPVTRKPVWQRHKASATLSRVLLRP